MRVSNGVVDDGVVAGSSSVFGMVGSLDGMICVGWEVVFMWWLVKFGLVWM